MKNMRIILTTVLVAMLAPLAFAHGGNKHIMGTVKQITNDSITVQTTTNETVTVNFDAKTKFQKSGATADVKQLKVGDRVVIDVPEQGKPTATLVRFGVPPNSAHGSHSGRGHN